MRVTPLSPYVMSCVGGAVKFRIVLRDGAVFNINLFDVKDDDIAEKFEKKKQHCLISNMYNFLLTLFAK